jgi:threonine/homoserine/homoserine lactone efflux protein
VTRPDRAEAGNSGVLSGRSVQSAPGQRDFTMTLTPPNAVILMLISNITPGPANFLVLEIGARRGVRAAVLAIAIFQLTYLVQLVLVWFGLAGLLQSHPALKSALEMAGALYIAWLGLSLIRTQHGASQEDAAPGMIGLALFNFTNPKSWLNVLTFSTLGLGEGLRLPALAAIMFGISVACLYLWAVVGAALSRMMQGPFGRWINSALGLLLIATAGKIAFDALA